MKWIAAILVIAAVAVGAFMFLPTLGAENSSVTGTGRTDTADVVEYAGDPEAEAAVVELEEQRLIHVRSIANAAQWTGAANGLPYRLVTGPTFTLVLIERAAPYTLDNVIDLGAIVLQPDGTYLLRENLVIEEGATLDLTSGDGLVLKLSSTSDAFVSIVTLGGSLSVKGTASAPVKVTSWDTTLDMPDANTEDGRAYVRVVGGHADLADARFENLGFWSGRTGGVSLTGTELPEVVEDEQPNAIVNGAELIPSTQQLDTLALDGDIAGYGYVSAFVRNVTFTGNAFGLFVSSADGVMVQNSTVLGSLVDGLVFHRNVRNSEIQSTESSGNAGDGFAITRAATGNLLTRVTSTGNGHNGITLEGGPLADGPSATGTPIGVYGDNRVTDSVASNNDRYGIQVSGGHGIRLDGNTIAGNEMGIVVNNDAMAATIADNEVLSSERQGIALRESGLDLVVEDNIVRGGDIGIYSRNSGGVFQRNEVRDVGSHAITLVGDTGNSMIAENVVAGIGPSAIDVARTNDAVLLENDTEAWRSTKPLDVVLRNIFQPLTVLWLTLGLLVVVSAVSGVRRRDTGIRHPYANLAPIDSFTKGVVAREQAAPVRPDVLEPV